MARLKLLFFALPVLGGWLFFATQGLTWAARHLSEQTATSLDRTAEGVGLKLAQRRSELQAALLKASTSPAYQAAARSAQLSVDATSFKLVRAAVVAALSEEDQREAVVSLTNGASATLVAQGAAEPSATLEGVDPASIPRGEAVGTMRGVSGAPYLFFSLPLGSSGEQGASVLVGAPALSKAAVEKLAQAPGLQSVSVDFEGKSAVAAGVSPGLLAVARKAKVQGLAFFDAQSASVGDVRKAFWLPWAVPVAAVGHKSVAQAPLEVWAALALASEPVAEAQHLVAGGTGGALLLLFLTFMLLRAPKDDGGFVVPGRVEAKESEDKAGPGPSAQAEAPAADGPEAMTPPPHPADPFPEFAPAPPRNPADDFSFGDGLKLAPPPVGVPADETVDAPTRVLNVADVAKLSAPPLPVAAADEDDYGSTRVMAVSKDLMAAAMGTATVEEAEPPMPVRVTGSRPAPTVAAVDDDEQHYQQVFQEFVVTRERCGESPDGMTFDRFAVKLRKNREQLVQKLNCRSVRFQVYVKEGKAAIKASPIRD
jgi:hypothetical protein